LPIVEQLRPPVAIPTKTFVVTDEGADEFAQAIDGAAAALERHEQAPLDRIAVHTGMSSRRAEHLRAVANPGQLLVSSLAARHIVSGLPATFRVCDLGIHRLRDLSAPERVYELRARGNHVPSPPLRSLDRIANNLPVELTTFVGRYQELAAVDVLLGRERLVTITGSGGSGKTRLAAHAAAASDRWRDGVWWIELQSVSDPRTVANVIASGIGALIDPIGGPLRSLARHLRDRRVLLCLDNCEHVVAGAAEAVEALIASCPDVTVLVTSREPLGVPGETVWRLPTLVADEAVELFVDRARHVRDDFTVGPGDEVVLRRLCAGLDGIPLAIELAAAWASTLTLQQIVAGLDDRFTLLVRSIRGAAARHQTLAASIDWSHDLLDERDRMVFRRLAVFRGGFTLDAAQAVGDRNDVLVALRALVDKSLVTVDERDGLSRFHLLETVRQYAERRLDEAGEHGATCDRHLDNLLAIAEAIEPELDRDKDAWCAVLDPEYDNLRAALDWGLAITDPERGRRLAAATSWLWNLYGRGREGVCFMRRAIDRAPGDRSILQARLMTGYAMIGDTVAPTDLGPVREGAGIAADHNDERLQGRCLTLTAVGTFYKDFDAGWQLCDEAARCARAVGDEFGLDAARALQGLILHFRDQHGEAGDLLQRVADRLIRRGDRGIASTVLVCQSNSALYTGDVPAAHQLAGQAADVARPLRDYHRVGTTLSQLALLRGIGGDVDSGLQLLERFVHDVEGAGPEVFVPGMARTLGLLHLWGGDSEAAVRWLGPDALAAGPTADTHIDALAMPGLAEAQRRLGRVDEAHHVLRRAGGIARRMGMPRVLADVVEQQAFLVAAADPDRAADLHHEALALRVDHGLRTFLVDSLDALAVLMAQANRPDDAIRMIAAADQARHVIGYPRHRVNLPEHGDIVTALRATLGKDAFEEARAEGSGRALDEAVAYARRTRGPRRRPTTGWASLTPTELEVVRLVADGLSNPEIGTKLFMGRGTVKTHLSHVFAKLDVANRTELATLAAGHLVQR
jgi:predicted ATPase/DNA-binding CsgD family transcriptional regulator